jgi:UDP-3-O-[3-hydroxymyristoyl] glucosamine N-acyltransferase
MELAVGQLAEKVGAQIFGDPSGLINRVWPIETAENSDVTFATEQRFFGRLANCKAGAVIVNRHIETLKIPQLVVKDVNAALIETLKIFAPVLEEPAVGIDKTAKVSPKAKIGKDVSIGPMAVIESNVEIGDKSVISAGVKIAQNSKIGSSSLIHSNVVIYHNCRIGNNCIIQANTTIGSTGFGYRFINGQHRLIPHNGGVIIEDFVEIGANCCVDRAKFGNTLIGAGTKIDNLVQIAHNCIIGKCCLIAGQSGIAGSTTLGDGVVLGGGAGIVDNVEIGSGVMIGARSFVIQDISEGQKVFGFPASKSSEALKIVGLSKRLPRIFEQVRKLNERIEKLESAKDNKE